MNLLNNIFQNFNPIFIVIPILFLLTFHLGTQLKMENFKQLYHYPKAIFIGLFGQIFVLPILSILIGKALHLPEIFQLGLLLIAASSGGSSSALFTYLIKGNLALSIILTTFSTILSIFTLPFWLFINFNSQITYIILLKIIGQNLLLCLLPLIFGYLTNTYFINKKNNNKNNFTNKLFKIYLCIINKLNKLIFPLLIIVAIVFFIQHFSTLLNTGISLFISIILLITSAMFFIYIINCISLFTIKDLSQKRTLIIEVGIQNAAQAITIAISPLTFNSNILAIPAIIYALVMNIILILYVIFIRKKMRLLQGKI